MADIVRYQDAAPLDVMTLGKVLSSSGYFTDAKDAAQAVVKVLAGQEMGIGAIAAMTGIYIVKGRVTLSANLMAAQIKRSGRYNYRVTRLDDAGCEIVFTEQGQEIGRSSFTAEDAKAAGLWNSSDPWKRTPRNMLFARAISNGAKWYCPDVFSGPVYTPDEIEAVPIVDVAPARPAAPQADKYTGEVIEPEAPAARDTSEYVELGKQLKALGYTGKQLKAENVAWRLEDIATMSDEDYNAIVGKMIEMGEAASNAKDTEPAEAVNALVPEAEPTF
jgi:hypothetical protein